MVTSDGSTSYTRLALDVSEDEYQQNSVERQNTAHCHNEAVDAHTLKRTKTWRARGGKGWQALTGQDDYYTWTGLAFWRFCGIACLSFVPPVWACQIRTCHVTNIQFGSSRRRKMERRLNDEGEAVEKRGGGLGEFSDSSRT